MPRPAASRIPLAVALIGMGAILLVLRFFGSFAGTIWPLFVIVPGLALFAISTSVGWHSRYLAASGAVVMGTGIILAVQNATDYYQSWAYAWALLPACAGVALIVVAGRDDDRAARATGRGLVLWGVVVFAALAALFELFIFRHGPVGADVILALLLIGVGAYLLFRGQHPTSGGATSADDRASRGS